MKVLIIGGTGMLGHKLVQILSQRYEVVSTIRGTFESVQKYGIFRKQQVIENVDVSDIALVRDTIETAWPDVVINAVGIVKQLPSSKDVIQTLTINSIFPRQVAALSAEFGFRFITISTDCVFSGSKGNYTETDVPDAVDLYGRSKQLGEVTEGNCLTLRTSIIGRELATAHSLIDWFLTQDGNRINGYAKAIYSGFPTIVFADIISSLISKHPRLSGLFHVSSEPINKYDLLNLVKKRLDFDVEIERFEDFKIDRSLDSTKFRNATGFRPPSWPDMIDRLFADETPYKNWK